MLLNWAKSRVALFLAGSNNDYPTYYLIGNGSGTVDTSQTELFNSIDRQPVTLINGSTIYKAKWIGDWNSVEMSGLFLQEWGLSTSGTALTGSMWSKTVMPANLTFDGTTELRIEETWEVY